MKKATFYILVSILVIVGIVILYAIVSELKTGGDIKLEYSNSDTDSDAKRSSLEYLEAAQAVCEQFFDGIKSHDKTVSGFEYTGFGKNYGHDDSCRIIYNDGKEDKYFNIGSK